MDGSRGDKEEGGVKRERDRGWGEGVGSALTHADPAISQPARSSCVAVAAKVRLIAGRWCGSQPGVGVVHNCMGADNVLVCI